MISITMTISGVEPMGDRRLQFLTKTPNAKHLHIDGAWRPLIRCMGESLESREH